MNQTGYRRICAAPCGHEETTSDSLPCNATNGLTPDQEWQRYNFSVAQTEKECRLVSHSFLRAVAPMTEYGGEYGGFGCAAVAPCPWSWLQSKYPFQRTNESSATISFSSRNITFGPDSIDLREKQRTIACPLAMGCPFLDSGPNSPLTSSAFTDILGTPFRCLWDGTSETGILVKIAGSGKIACATERDGSATCVELAATCCVMWNSTGIRADPFNSKHGMSTPFLECGGSESEMAPGHWCQRARPLLANLAPFCQGPDCTILGPNCTYKLPGNSFYADPGAGPWIPVSFDHGSLIVVLRRTGDGGVASLDDLDPASSQSPHLRFPTLACAESAARTAPNDALSSKWYPDRSYFTEAVVAVNATIAPGPLTCIKICADQEFWILGRTYGVGVTQYLYHQNPSWPRLYTDDRCNNSIYGELDNGFATCYDQAVRGNSTTCNRIGQALTKGTTEIPLCRDRASAVPVDVPWTCIQSCADQGHYLRIRATSSNLDLAQCQGPDDSRCSWYLEKHCSTLAPGEPAPDLSGQLGKTCVPEDLNRTSGTQWCLRAQGLTAYSGPEPCPTTGPANWTCIKNCNGTFFFGTSRAVEFWSGGCLGPRYGPCTWFLDSSCTTLAPGSALPVNGTNATTGYKCGWGTQDFDSAFTMCALLYRKLEWGDETGCSAVLSVTPTVSTGAIVTATANSVPSAADRAIGLSGVVARMMIAIFACLFFVV